MKSGMFRIASFLTAVVLLVSCGQGKKSAPAPAGFKSFPHPEVPAMIQGVMERQQYVTKHFWDAFFDLEGPCDSSSILAVKKDEVEQNLSAYIGLLNMQPVGQAQKNIADFFSALETRQAKDEKSLLYLQLTELVAKYLYDPNSPLRSEDLYLPFVEGMVNSRFTAADKMAAYRFELEKCRLNPYGSIAPDFRFKDIKGRVSSLHKQKGEHIMLFFSNPGCQSCLDIINAIQSRPYIPAMLASGSLSIVNIYIDYDIDSWKSYAHEYPESWINAYDYEHRIYGDEIYYVRAIPSLYLLDSEKRIIFKDVPVERALAYIEETLKIQ